MKRIFAPILLLTLLFPALAQGQSLNDWVGKGKGLLCETTGVGCPESVDFKDLVKRDGLYFKKRTDIPFTGKTTGDEQGSFKNGKKDGSWISYYDNGQLLTKRPYKNGKKDGPWVGYHKDAKLRIKGTLNDGKKDGPWVWFYDNGQLRSKGIYKNGKKDGPWVSYHDNGQLEAKGTYKNGVKVSD